MTMTADTATPPALPAPTLATLGAVTTAGAFATIAFDVFGQSISPLLGFSTLAPVPLAKSVLNTVFGISSTPLAHLLHYFTGMFAYVIGWLLIVRPLAGRFVPQLPWWALAVAYGISLWVFALYGMAHLVAGMPPFLGFSGITWVALVGHVVYAVVMAAVLQLRPSTETR